MSEQQPKQTLILPRLKALEELTNGMAGFLQTEVLNLKQLVGGLKQFEANIVEIINAMMGVLSGAGALGFWDGDFTSKVQNQVMLNRNTRQKEMLEKAVSDGLLVSVPVVTENSLLVGKEMLNDGTILNAGRTQVEYSQLTEKAKAIALNSGVGALIQSDDGTFEILEIYELGKKASSEEVLAPAPESNVEPTVN